MRVAAWRRCLGNRDGQAEPPLRSTPIAQEGCLRWPSVGGAALRPRETWLPVVTGSMSVWTHLAPGVFCAAPLRVLVRGPRMPSKIVARHHLGHGRCGAGFAANGPRFAAGRRRLPPPVVHPSPVVRGGCRPRLRALLRPACALGGALIPSLTACRLSLRRRALCVERSCSSSPARTPR